ncbi:MAG: hypothetical protein M0C28_08085 [Candidatus Moduliflexus flocculans]|nr:hypothetical protein [Candidatus Moduliflexus flocculans]
MGSFLNIHPQPASLPPDRTSAPAVQFDLPAPRPGRLGRASCRNPAVCSCPAF